MIVIAGFFRFPPENLAAAQPVMAQVIAASREEAGCEHYAFSHDILEPGMIRVSELWTDQAALAAHAASPHVAAWRAAGSALGIHDRTLTGYEATGSRPL